MTQTPPAPAPPLAPGPATGGTPLDAAGRIAGDLPCKACGYNLRTLSPDAACPECGTAVGASAIGDLLRYSDPAWVGRVASGTRFIVVAAVLVVAIYLVGFAIEIVRDAGALPYELAGLVAGTTSVVGLIAAFIAFLVGVFRVTAPEPGDQADTRRASRRLARWGVLAGNALYFGGLVLAVATEQLWLALLTLAGIAVTSVGLVALFVRMRRFARRVPSPSLARQTTIVMWGLCLSYGVAMLAMIGFLTGSFGFILSENAPPWLEALLGALFAVGALTMCASAVVGLGFTVWLFVLLFWYRAVLLRAAADARATWAASA